MSSPSSPFLQSCQDALQEHFGFAEFRPGQAEVLEALGEGRDALVVMPTGGGKSLCYQIPALALEGVTLVISPLIALMKDQVDALQARGIAATMIHSGVSLEEQRERLDALERGEYKLIYVAPERFRARAFVRALSQVKLALFAVDEAHCLSQWGHDFRPDYLRLGQIAQDLGRPPLVALTATATEDVRADINSQLQLRNNALRLIRGFERPNLSLRILPTRSKLEKLAALETLITEQKTGIVYCATRKRVEEVETELKGQGIHCTAYHAGLTDIQRRERQERFLEGKVDVVIATNAFGMGIDRADLRFIAHYELPGSVEAYYQEVGRAGRDGKPAVAQLYYSYADTRTQEFFIDGRNPTPALIAQTYRKLHHLCGDDAQVLISIDELAEQLDEKNSMSVHAALSELSRLRVIQREDIPGSRIRATRITGPEPAELKLDLDSLAEKDRRDRNRLQQMVNFAQSKQCRQQWILRYFGQENPQPCGQCDRCLSAEGVDFISPSEAQHLLVRQVLAGVARSSRKQQGQWVGRFGKYKIVAMLRGSEAQAFLKSGLQKTSTYGLLKQESEEFLLDLMEALREIQLLEVQEGDYPLWALSAAGDQVMRDPEAEFQLPWPNSASKTGKTSKASQEAKPKKARQSTKATPKLKESDLSAEDFELYHKLAEKRLQLAREAEVPAFTIFSNQVLAQLALHRPQSQEEALEVNGIGEAKVAEWMPEFLPLLQGSDTLDAQA